MEFGFPPQEPSPPASRPGLDPSFQTPRGGAGQNQDSEMCTCHHRAVSTRVQVIGQRQCHRPLSQTRQSRATATLRPPGPCWRRPAWLQMQGGCSVPHAPSQPAQPPCTSWESFGHSGLGCGPVPHVGRRGTVPAELPRPCSGELAQVGVTQSREADQPASVMSWEWPCASQRGDQGTRNDS